MSGTSQYSLLKEAGRILNLLCREASQLGLPPEIAKIKDDVEFESDLDQIYFPIPFKETETAAALKAIEGGVASALEGLKNGSQHRKIKVNLEKATCFLFQAYLATVGGLGKQDDGVRDKLKDTDLLQAQSNPYRRMSANLYETKDPGRYYHIHGSLEASTQLKALGLEPFRPDLESHEDIVDVIEPAVKSFTVQELEELNSKHRQAGVEAMKHEDFVKTPHGQSNTQVPPWNITCLENDTPAIPLPRSSSGSSRILEGIKVLSLCRIIAGPTITRILAEYGADVLKVTGPGLSDVPFFQVDGNIGNHATEIDLKSAEGRKIFEKLLEEADLVVEGYRPGALENLGYGPKALAEISKKRNKGIVYVSENCFGHEGEWAGRAGWQQIADCVSGIAWEQGKFMGLNEPIVPPFPMSDYGTGCMGAIAALSGLYHRATSGGSWHGKVSLLQYDLLLFRVGLYPPQLQSEMRKHLTPEFKALRHSHSVDQIGKAARTMMIERFPELFDGKKYRETWFCEMYNEDVSAVGPVVEIEGVEVGWRRGSRPNGSDLPTWDFGIGGDYKK